MVDNTEQDDGIIELTQVVDGDSSDAPDQDVIELIDIDTQIEDTNAMDLDVDFDAGAAAADDSIPFEDGDMGFDFDMDETGTTVSEPENEISKPVPTMASVSELPASAVDSTITQEQVDAALERVIEKKFEKKIEKILLEVMEKVLEKEIVDIRKRLQNDLDEVAGS